MSHRFRQQAENFFRLAKETDSPRLRWVLVEMAQLCYRLSEMRKSVLDLSDIVC